MPTAIAPAPLSCRFKKTKPIQPIKRKRTDTPDDTDSQTSQHQRKNRDGPKKKKANRACFHCQKAHLTCDDSRPCQRCIKRGIANNCTEGLRKKAKYLLDDEEIEQIKRSNKSSAPDRSSEPVRASVPPADSFQQTDPMFNVPFDPNFPFGSEAANLEYSILSAILGNPSPPESGSSPPATQPPSTASFSSWTNDALAYPSSNANTTNSYATTFPDPPLSTLPADSLTNSHGPSGYVPAFATSPAKTSASPQASTSASFRQSQQPTLHPLQPRPPLPSDYSRSPSISTPSATFLRPNPKDPGFLSPASITSPISVSSVPAGHSTDTATPPTPSSSLGLASVNSQLQSINDRVTSPYDYTEGYHFLMKHLPSRFEKNDILRIVRALAIFRPSLIALQMPLSLDDEVFVEKCFQRSLLEMDKLISYSGTPTVVWRRTGEICLVAPEFSMLTEWPMEELVGRKKYIYELLENQSVVEYWENFASHAFENTTQSVYSHCVLLKPNGAPVPTTFCFSIRRDLFDLPSMVIGQWLPLL
ncbi:hypothetical protein ONZ45_g16984 [Pleurotus djamor]|nr:hypothetical protein ONZ45_g16984 [Pleurotus djamor]